MKTEAFRSLDGRLHDGEDDCRRANRIFVLEECGNARDELTGRANFSHYRMASPEAWAKFMTMLKNHDAAL